MTDYSSKTKKAKNYINLFNTIEKGMIPFYMEFFLILYVKFVLAYSEIQIPIYKSQNLFFYSSGRLLYEDSRTNQLSSLINVLDVELVNVPIIIKLVILVGLAFIIPVISLKVLLKTCFILKKKNSSKTIYSHFIYYAHIMFTWILKKFLIWLDIIMVVYVVCSSVFLNCTWNSEKYENSVIAQNEETAVVGNPLNQCTDYNYILLLVFTVVNAVFQIHLKYISFWIFSIIPTTSFKSSSQHIHSNILCEFLQYIVIFVGFAESNSVRLEQTDMYVYISIGISVYSYLFTIIFRPWYDQEVLKIKSIRYLIESAFYINLIVNKNIDSAFTKNELTSYIMVFQIMSFMIKYTISILDNQETHDIFSLKHSYGTINMNVLRVQYSLLAHIKGICHSLYNHGSIPESYQNYLKIYTHSILEKHQLECADIMCGCHFNEIKDSFQIKWPINFSNSDKTFLSKLLFLQYKSLNNMHNLDRSSFKFGQSLIYVLSYYLGKLNLAYEVLMNLVKFGDRLNLQRDILLGLGREQINASAKITLRTSHQQFIEKNIMGGVENWVQLKSNESYGVRSIESYFDFKHGLDLLKRLEKYKSMFIKQMEIRGNVYSKWLDPQPQLKDLFLEVIIFEKGNFKMQNYFHHINEETNGKYVSLIFLHANYFQHVKINKIESHKLGKKLYLLKKIQVNQDYKFSENLVDSSCVIMSISGEKMTIEQVNYVSRNCKSMFGFKYDELHSLTQILPKPIKFLHKLLIEPSYYSGYFLNADKPRTVFFTTKQGHLLDCYLNIKLTVSNAYGLCFIGYFMPEDQQSHKDLIVINEYGTILERSKSCKTWLPPDFPNIKYLNKELTSLLENFTAISYLIMNNDSILKEPIKLVCDYNLTNKLIDYKKLSKGIVLHIDSQKYIDSNTGLKKPLSTGNLTRKKTQKNFRSKPTMRKATTGVFDSRNSGDLGIVFSSDSEFSDEKDLNRPEFKPVQSEVRFQSMYMKKFKSFVILVVFKRVLPSGRQDELNKSRCNPEQQISNIIKKDDDELNNNKFNYEKFVDNFEKLKNKKNIKLSDEDDDQVDEIEEEEDTCPIENQKIKVFDIKPNRDLFNTEIIPILDSDMKSAKSTIINIDSRNNIALDSKNLDSQVTPVRVDFECLNSFKSDITLDNDISSIEKKRRERKKQKIKKMSSLHVTNGSRDGDNDSRSDTTKNDNMDKKKSTLSKSHISKAIKGTFELYCKKKSGNSNKSKSESNRSIDSSFEHHLYTSQNHRQRTYKFLILVGLVVAIFYILTFINVYLYQLRDDEVSSMIKAESNSLDYFFSVERDIYGFVWIVEVNRLWRDGFLTDDILNDWNLTSFYLNETSTLFQKNVDIYKNIVNINNQNVFSGFNALNIYMRPQYIKLNNSKQNDYNTTQIDFDKNFTAHTNINWETSLVSSPLACNKILPKLDLLAMRYYPWTDSRASDHQTINYASHLDIYEEFMRLNLLGEYRNQIVSFLKNSRFNLQELNKIAFNGHYFYLGIFVSIYQIYFVVLFIIYIQIQKSFQKLQSIVFYVNKPELQKVQIYYNLMKENMKHVLSEEKFNPKLEQHTNSKKQINAMNHNEISSYNIHKKSKRRTMIAPRNFNYLRLHRLFKLGPNMFLNIIIGIVNILFFQYMFQQSSIIENQIKFWALNNSINNQIRGQGIFSFEAVKQNNSIVNATKTPLQYYNELQNDFVKNLSYEFQSLQGSNFGNQTEFYNKLLSNNTVCDEILPDYSNCTGIYGGSLKQNLLYSYKGIANSFDDIVHVYIGSLKNEDNLKDILLSNILIENYKFFLSVLEAIRININQQIGADDGYEKLSFYVLMEVTKNTKNMFTIGISIFVIIFGFLCTVWVITHTRSVLNWNKATIYFQPSTLIENNFRLKFLLKKEFLSNGVGVYDI